MRWAENLPYAYMSTQCQYLKQAVLSFISHLVSMHQTSVVQN